MFGAIFAFFKVETVAPSRSSADSQLSAKTGHFFIGSQRYFAVKK